MRKLLALAALTMGIGSLAMTDVQYAEAQGKKEVKKTTVKEDATKVDPKKADASVGTIEIYKARDGYRFRIKDADGKVAAMPVKGLDTEKDVEKALEFIKATLNKAKPTVVKD